MGTLYNDINWIKNSEKGTEDVLNRPLKQLVAKLDAYEYTNSTIPLADVDLEGGSYEVQDGDVVYRYEEFVKDQFGSYVLDNGEKVPYTPAQYIYGRAIFDLTSNNEYRKDKPFGVVRKYDGDWYLVFSGPVEIPGANFKVGQIYYLSDTELGQVKEYQGKVAPGAVRIGKALTPTHLLVEIDEDRQIEQGAYEIPVEEVGTIVDSDLVYFNGTAYEKAINDETSKNELVGIYKKYDQKHYIVYDGVVEFAGTTFVQGKSYYLSDSNAGKSKTYTTVEAPDAVFLGRALTTDTLLVNITHRVLPTNSLYNVHSSEVTGLSDGDFVYRDGTVYKKALSNSGLESACSGVYKIYDNKHYIVFDGPVEITGVTSTTDYYLSDINAGEYKTYGEKVAPSAIKLGRGLDDGILLLDIGRHEYPENGLYEITVAEVGTIQDSDIVYYNGSTYELAFNSGLNTDVVSGMYKIYDNRHYIVYSGYTEVLNTTLTPTKKHYLTTDENNKGKIIDTFNEVSIGLGIAVDESHIIINIDRDRASAQFFSLTISSEEVGTIDNADIVYAYPTGGYERALSDGSETGLAVGFYVNSGLQHYIIYAGFMEFTNTELDKHLGINERFVIGQPYYLDALRPGMLTMSGFPGATRMGIAISENALQVDIDASTGGDAVAEAIEYEFFLQQSPFNRCYSNTFEKPDTALLTGNASYVARYTAFKGVDTGDIISTTESIFGADNVEFYDKFYTYVNQNGKYFDMEYSVDTTDGTDGTWLPTAHQEYIYVVDKDIDGNVGTDNLWFRFIRNSTPLAPTHTEALIYSYGFLYDEDGITGMSTYRMREYYVAPEDLVPGTIIPLPNRKSYTNDGVSLDVHINGKLMQYGVDYYEVNATNVQFADAIPYGWVIEFREYYGYVDVSFENSLRVGYLEGAVGLAEELTTNTTVSTVYAINELDKEMGDHLEMTTRTEGGSGAIAATVVEALNTHDLELGELDDSTTATNGVQEPTIVAALNRHDLEIGDFLETSTTKQYDNVTQEPTVVDALNRHDLEIGNTSELHTENKVEIVGSINELHDATSARDEADTIDALRTFTVTPVRKGTVDSGIPTSTSVNFLGTVNLDDTEEYLSKYNLDGYKENGVHEQYTGDLNAIDRNSVYNIETGTVTNEPSTMSAWAFIVTMVHTNNTSWISQSIYGMQDEDQWKRQKTNGVWSQWTKTLTSTENNTINRGSSDLIFDMITASTANLLINAESTTDVVFDGKLGSTLKVTSEQDATIIIEADTDDATETDNPTLRFLQDGSLERMDIGLDSNNKSYITTTGNTKDLVITANTDINTDKLTITTPTGYVDIGSGNASYVHFTTDRNDFYFNTNVQVDGDISVYQHSAKLSGNNVYGSTFYDSDDNSKYLNPTVTSELTNANLSGFLTVGGNTTVNGNTTLGNTNSDTLTLNATATVTANITFSDSKHLYLGTSNDLNIYHDGSNSFIEEQGTGDLYIQSTSGSINLRTSTTENAIVCNQNSSIELYYDNAKKLETTSTGVSVTGNITHDGLTMTSGTDIDQLYTVTKSLSFTAFDWADTGIYGGTLPSGTYIVQVYADNHLSSGGSQYEVLYSGTMSWRGDNTNGTNSCEITLHSAGHTENAQKIFLRTLERSGSSMMLQMSSNVNVASNNYTFKFRRMI